MPGPFGLGFGKGGLEKGLLSAGFFAQGNMLGAGGVCLATHSLGDLLNLTTLGQESLYLCLNALAGL